jgi:hypothetical protein
MTVSPTTALSTPAWIVGAFPVPSALIYHVFAETDFGEIKKKRRTIAETAK